MIRFNYKYFLTAIFGIACLSSSVFADLKDILNSGKVKIAVPESFAPFGSIGSEGKHVGYDVDVAKLVAKDLGVKLELVPVSSKQRIPFLETDRVERLPEVSRTQALLSSGLDHLGAIPEIELGVRSETGNVGDGPIRYVSEQLTHFSDYVTAAAQDVERTEALIRNLNEANSHLNIFGNLISAVQGQVNILTSQLSSRDYQTNEPQIASSNNDSDDGQADHPIFREPTRINHLKEIRLASDQAERALHSTREVMKVVNAIAQDIAKTASDQALEATNKLLSQSQHLQQMLH